MTGRASFGLSGHGLSVTGGSAHVIGTSAGQQAYQGGLTAPDASFHPDLGRHWYEGSQARRRRAHLRRSRLAWTVTVSPEVNVSQAPARPRPPARHFTLNTDGQRHPLINAAAAYTIGAGLASFVLGMLSLSHFICTLLGVTGFIVGLLAQMASATRAERMFIVFGIVASFVGMGLGFAHGGFSIGSGGGTGIS
jgi:hypothetical protein